MTFEPINPKRRNRQSYYQPRRHNARLDPEVDVFDIAHAYDLTPARTMALKYLVRAGRKCPSTEDDDIQKAIEVLMMERELFQDEAMFGLAHSRPVPPEPAG